jgi:hypothetical protein
MAGKRRLNSQVPHNKSPIGDRRAGSVERCDCLCSVLNRQIYQANSALLANGDPLQPLSVTAPPNAAQLTNTLEGHSGLPTALWELENLAGKPSLLLHCHGALRRGLLRCRYAVVIEPPASQHLA